MLKHLTTRHAACMLLMLCCSAAAIAQTDAPKTELLWPQGAPGAMGSAPVDQPRLTLFPAARVAGRETHTAVLVLPGGGYHALATSYEGIDICRWLNNLGVSAFMLEYRLGPKYHHPIELGDAARGLRWVRQHAAQYGYDPQRVGIWGFSAGGHLASTLATHFDAGHSDSPDPIERVSSRPDFLILAYAVIDPIGPGAVGSFNNLLGEPLDPRLVQELSNDLHVTAETPPTFMVQTGTDEIVYPENSVNFYLALRKAGVPAEMHLYQTGRHGFGLAPLDPILSSWPGRLADWLRLRGLLNTN